VSGGAMLGQTHILHDYAWEASVIIISYFYYFKAVSTSYFVLHYFL